MLAFKKYCSIRFIITSFLILSVFCAKLPPKPEFNNPQDQNSPYYTAPTVEIITGPENGKVLDIDQVSFTWIGSDNIRDYSFQLAGRDTGWSEYADTMQVDYKYLDEGEYTFYVKGRTTAKDSAIDSVGFYVDAIKGPALVCRPKYQEVETGEDFVIDIMAEEVDSLLAVKFIIIFDTLKLAADSIINGPFFAGNNGSIVAFNDICVDSIMVNIGVVGGNPPVVNGSGVLVKILLKSKGTGQTELIFLNDSYSMRDHKQNDISLLKLVNMTIVN